MGEPRRTPLLVMNFAARSMVSRDRLRFDRSTDTAPDAATDMSYGTIYLGKGGSRTHDIGPATGNTTATF